ncbi:MAG: anhydro-N-acetylmuramic acid kinase [Bacteroidales bacterium]|nr:anhydro-N-acetylmuramic acid kinase [Bacteroidales bacterium]
MKELFEKKQVNALGLMSGTSMDGLDLALCSFVKEEDGRWDYKIVKAETIPYTSDIINLLNSAYDCGGAELVYFDSCYGEYLGYQVTDFLNKHKLNADIISSHGHTIFHAPDKGYTCQIGKGSAISAIAKIPVVSDFRSKNVALGGQGAPLVPIGDMLLFNEYDACINIGGFSNISYYKRKRIAAFDICPANMAINYFTQKLGVAYDNNGDIAQSGSLDKDLFQKLNSLAYYKSFSQKSLGREWFESEFLPLVMNVNIPVNDIIRTITEHISYQIAKSINYVNANNVLISGGGAYNSFLIEGVRTHVTSKVHVPDAYIVDFKEAMVFAFLGVLFVKGEENVLSSYTGASRDSICGTLSV